MSIAWGPRCWASGNEEISSSKPIVSLILGVTTQHMTISFMSWQELWKLGNIICGPGSSSFTHAMNLWSTWKVKASSTKERWVVFIEMFPYITKYKQVVDSRMNPLQKGGMIWSNWRALSISRRWWMWNGARTRWLSTHSNLSHDKRTSQEAMYKKPFNLYYGVFIKKKRGLWLNWASRKIISLLINLIQIHCN